MQKKTGIASTLWHASHFVIDISNMVLSSLMVLLTRETSPYQAQYMRQEYETMEQLSGKLFIKKL